MSEYSPQSSLLPPQEEEYPPLSHANRILYTPHQQTHTPDDGDDDDGNSSMNYILKFSRRRIFYLPTHTHAHKYSIIALETKKHKIFPLATFFHVFLFTIRITSSSPWNTHPLSPAVRLSIYICHLSSPVDNKRSSSAQTKDTQNAFRGDATILLIVSINHKPSRFYHSSPIEQNVSKATVQTLT